VSVLVNATDEYPVVACITRAYCKKMQELIPEVRLPWAPLVDIYTAVRMCCFALFFFVLTEVLLCSFVYYVYNNKAGSRHGTQLILQTIPMNHMFIQKEKENSHESCLYIYIYIKGNFYEGVGIKSGAHK
jgi:hypothetical protein